MYLTVLMLISSLLCLGMIVNLWQVRKHDIVLFRLCQVRRKSMSLLRDRGFNLAKDDYMALRRMLYAVNTSIAHYSVHKAKLFNLRAFARAVKEYKRSAVAVEKLAIPKDKEIIDIYRDFNYAMMTGFLAYTPFIKSELGLRFTVILISLLAKAGFASLQQLFDNLMWARDHIQGNQGMLSSHA